MAQANRVIARLKDLDDLASVDANVTFAAGRYIVVPTLYGGAAANDNIVIHGTSHATKTTSYVILQPSGGNVGIGTASPAALLHVNGTGAVATSLVVGGTSTSGKFEVIGAVGNLVFDTNGNVLSMTRAAANYLTASSASGTMAIITNGLTPSIANSSIYMDTAQRVGIGGQTPSTALHVNGTTTTTALAATTATVGGVDVVTLSATQTLTNKTLTAPTLSGGPTLVQRSGTGATITMYNAANTATWNLYAGVSASGEFSIFDVAASQHRLRVDGSGVVTIAGTATVGTLTATSGTVGGANIVTVSATQTLTNKTINSPTIATPTITTSAVVPLIYGGVNANDNIVIHGTSHATKTTSYVILQPSGGNVGIATATPGGLLDVAGSSGNFRVATSGNVIELTRNSLSYLSASSGSGEIALVTNGLTPSIANSSIYADASKRVGIGGVTPTSALTVSGTTTTTAATIANPADVGRDDLIIQSPGPDLTWYETDGATDNKYWDMRVSAERFLFRVINDANSAASNIFTVDRTGTTVDSIDFGANTTVTGTFNATSTITQNSVAVVTISGTQTLTNKTLTTPTLSGGAVSVQRSGVGATITMHNAANTATWNLYAGVSASGEFSFFDVVAASHRLRIDGAGLVTIGGTLDVGGTARAGGLHVDADGGGVASTVGLSSVSDLSANSSGTGTILFKGTTSRNSVGFIKIYIGTTAYYVPVFDAITG